MAKEIHISKLWTATAVIVVIAAGLIFTSPGHRMLYALGFTAACGVSDNC